MHFIFLKRNGTGVQRSPLRRHFLWIGQSDLQAL